ncbi:uncharacterized protein LOC122500132 [Leptopilina heterotoma]|uniref:uncharacterized protein LOC122500132 n=1 Tax=Leptopilina heterotoma TaxID=63436 RepID=UPI001CA947E6|nr:uncharacterized protein LOC122500132 [Leptopilina heterotoma]
MESSIKDSLLKSLSQLEMNKESTVSVKLENIIPPLKDRDSQGNQVEDFIKILKHIVACIERNSKNFTALNPPSKYFSEDPQTRITNLRDYCFFFIRAIRENILWKYANVEYGLWPSNGMFCAWKTLCFALFDNPTFCDTLLHDKLYYPTIVQDYITEKVPLVMKTVVIILSDSDLDTVVSFLASVTERPCVWKISAVYIQESIEKKFAQLYKEKKTKDSVNIDKILTIFRFKEEISSKIKDNHWDAISIWTENVLSAKHYVMNMMVSLVWINSFGELGPGVALRTDSKLKCPNVSRFELKSGFFTGSGKKFDLFYDGLWKEPKNGKYWTDCNGNSWASASQEDVDSCVQSAKRGFEKWHLTPFSKRKTILQKFADRIHADGNRPLAKLVRSQLDNPILYGSSSTIIRDGTVEVLTVRDPKGVIAIGRKDSNDLFLRVINACIAGNAVIVMYGGVLSPINEYCDMMITSGIPPGVINFLSFENLFSGFKEVYNNSAVAHGCSPAFEEFDVFMLDFFKYWIDLVTDDNDCRFKEMLYTKYTQPKSIWLPFK